MVLSKFWANFETKPWIPSLISSELKNEDGGAICWNIFATVKTIRMIFKEDPSIVIIDKNQIINMNSWYWIKIHVW